MKLRLKTYPNWSDFENEKENCKIHDPDEHDEVR